MASSLFWPDLIFLIVVYTFGVMDFLSFTITILKNAGIQKTVNATAPFSMGSITDSGWDSSRVHPEKVHPENLKCWVDDAEQRYPMFRSVSQSGIGRRWSNAYDIYFAIPISAYAHLIPEEGLCFSGFYDIKSQDLDLIVMIAISILE